MELRDRLQASLGTAYRVERELAGGGMSRVFVARDMALKREIVVKVLRQELGTAVSMERFRREIALAATLQHPHIVPLLAAGEYDGLPYYTMPFVRGESLRHHLARRSIGVVEAIHILRAVASALAHAHGEGVVHRDIKPGNVLLSGGVAVVTDFGIAKALDAAGARAGEATGLTSIGIAVGTPTYMSPEQASADPQVDHRADIYSFGCLAYEVLSGAPPFADRSTQELLTAHLHATPVLLSSRAPTVPPALGALVMQCLAKTPSARPQSAAELLAGLDLLSTPIAGMTPEPREAVGRRRALHGLLSGGVAVIVLGTIALVVFRNREQRLALYVAGNRSPIAVTPAIEYQPAISPDGQQVAFVQQTPGGYKIFVARSDGGRPVLLTGELPGDHFAPNWSPDGSRIVFHTNLMANGGAYVVPALPGTPRRVIVASSGLIKTPVWSPDGKEIAYGDQRGIWVQPVDSGSARLIAKGSPFHSPAWSPDGARLAFVQGDPSTLNNISSTRIRTVPAHGGLTTNVTDSTQANLSPVWTPDGRSLLYVSNASGASDVYQQPVRADGKPFGAPTRLTIGLDPSSVSLSKDGSRLVFDAIQRQANVWMAMVGSRTSSAVQITSDRQTVECMSLSHDGQWLAYDSNRAGNFDIYKVRVDGRIGEPVQLTTNPANDFCPAWSPDDREIAFHSARRGPRDIFLISAEGRGEQVIVADSVNKYEPWWSMDGHYITYQAGTSSVVLIEQTGPSTWSSGRVVARGIGGTAAAPLSPDGQWVAVGGRQLRLVPVGGGPDRVILVASEVGGLITWPKWSSDGTTIYAHVAPLASAGSGGGVVVGGPLTRNFAVPVAGGPPRTVLVEDASRPFSRGQFATDGRRIFFTSAAIASDVYLLELRPKPRE
jgi:Tol biopolymer transport system component/tRNA A-37 threonylcarbamoyl transferase component Bud32